MSAICIFYTFTLCGALPAQEPTPAGALESGLFCLASEIPLGTGVNSVSYAPDGKRFLVVARMVDDDVGSPVSFRGGRRDRSAAGVAELRVVVDWFEEIRHHSE